MTKNNKLFEKIFGILKKHQNAHNNQNKIGKYNQKPKHHSHMHI